jgi:hypothetical protein
MAAELDARDAGERHLSRRYAMRRQPEALAIVTTEGRIMAMRLLLATTLLLAVALWWLR